ncbi:MAG: metal-dependent transcriptional regulator [Planctomycetes bacterium]|nr:metal-dependent transcriptional regulator [Planctomycetota bacterium]MBI3847675.1 metal-dependent transcriptional regulator [Planctomycetota bacterium]
MDLNRKRNARTRPESNRLSHEIEDYLKAIYKIVESESPRPATTSAVAAALSVSPASVTSMLKKLHAMKLVRYERYYGVSILPAGRKIALEVIRHHRLLELYLQSALGYSWDRVDAEAERLEHVISEEMEDRIDALLGHPTVDPHGDPIPTKNGVVARPSHRGLTDLSPGETAVVCRVADQDGAKLRYLATLRLVPGARVTVVEKGPFGEPLVVRVGKSRHVLGAELASQVKVRPGASLRRKVRR